MIPDDIDPSLCAGEPLLDSLEDGFSPPARDDDGEGTAAPPAPGQPPESTLGHKSPF